MIAAINGYHDPEVLATIRSKGFGMCRFGTLEGALDLAPLAAVRAADLVPLIIVRDGDQVQEWAAAAGNDFAGAHVELWNEPDGAVDGYIAPADYAARIPDFVAACQEARVTPWIGAISNLHTAALGWMSEMTLAAGEIPAGVGVTFHRYPAGRTWDIPHRGFDSREQEMAVLRSIVGSTCPLACSEFGYHTATQMRSRYLPRNWPSNQWRWTDEETAVQIAREWEWFASQNLAFAVLYQITDGPSDHREDRFGIRRLDGSWKPSADVIPI